MSKKNKKPTDWDKAFKPAKPGDYKFKSEDATCILFRDYRHRSGKLDWHVEGGTPEKPTDDQR